MRTLAHTWSLLTMSHQYSTGRQRRSSTSIVARLDPMMMVWGAPNRAPTVAKHNNRSHTSPTGSRFVCTNHRMQNGRTITKTRVVKTTLKSVSNGWNSQRDTTKRLKQMDVCGGFVLDDSSESSMLGDQKVSFTHQRESLHRAVYRPIMKLQASLVLPALAVFWNTATALFPGAGEGNYVVFVSSPLKSQPTSHASSHQKG